MLDVFFVHAVPAIIAGVWNLICMGLDRLGVGRGLPVGNRDGVGLALGDYSEPRDRFSRFN
jgi:hypothetical protein